VIREARITLNFRHAPSARALSCLLLFLIVFGATADVVHHHDLFDQPRTVSASFNLDSVRATDQTYNSTGDPLRSKDCPVCQLHKQLSNGLLYEPVFTPAPPTEYAPATVTTVSLLSAFATPRRGRAPPQTSLS
jgi:hypothetical protein